MRRSLLLALATTLLAPAAAHAGAYADAVRATPGLAGYWRLGEASGTSVANAAGGPAGSLSLAQLGVAGALHGDADTAARFSGSSSASLGDGPAFAGAMTVEAWVNPDAPRSSYVVSDGGSSSGYHLALGADGAPAFNVAIGGTLVQVRGSALVSGAWHHLVGTVDATEVALYVDGVQRAAKPRTGAPIPSASPLRLGRYSSSSSSYLRGSLDEVAVYGAALSGTTVRQHYDLGADTRVPTTALTAAPGAWSSSADATLAFAGDAAGLTFQCRLNAAAWAACSSPVTLRSLPDGVHSFHVRAVNRYGIVGPVTAERSWTVDTGAPDTRALAILPSAVTPSASVTFASEAGARFECRRGDGSWSACASPLQVAAGADLAVRAIDQAGNADLTPAVVSLPAAPTAPAAAVAQLTGPSAKFSFSSVGSGRLECSLDGAAWSSCGSPLTVGPLAPGAHRVAVRGQGGSGPAPASAEVGWTVALVAPRLVGFQFPVLLYVPPARKIRAAAFPQSRLPALRFSLNVDAALRVRLDHVAAGGKARRLRAWSIAGRTGANVYRVPLAVYRTLRAGRYRLTAEAAGPAGRSAAQAVRFHVVRKAR